jgi:hypothetical protein
MAYPEPRHLQMLTLTAFRTFANMDDEAGESSAVVSWKMGHNFLTLKAAVIHIETENE